MSVDEQVTRDLNDAYPVTTDEMSNLHMRLANAAQAQDLLDIAYRTYDSPLGPLLLAATGIGLVRLALPNEERDAVLEELAEKVSPRILEDHRRLDATSLELDEYFDHRRNSFEVALDRQLSRGFRREVLDHLPEIPFGQTVSYTAVAQLVGRPKAVRAVGTACATNPIPIVVPCHRVLRSDGSLGGYRGGLDAKKQLLRLESSDR